MSSRSHVLEPQSAASAKLAAEIAGLVAQALRGDAVDTAAKGEELAARYPLAGMSGAMVGEAILRATGMVTMIREAPRPAPETTSATGSDEPASNGVGDPVRAGSDTEHAAMDDALGAALEADLSSLVSSANAEPPALVNGRASGVPSAVASEQRGSFASGAAAALRRAFFKG